MSLNPLKVVPTLISIIRFSSYYGYSLCYGKYSFESRYVTLCMGSIDHTFNCPVFLNWIGDSFSCIKDGTNAEWKTITGSIFQPIEWFCGLFMGQLKTQTINQVGNIKQLQSLPFYHPSLLNSRQKQHRGLIWFFTRIASRYGIRTDRQIFEIYEFCLVKKWFMSDILRSHIFSWERTNAE